jgi:hypothetical protein
MVNAALQRRVGPRFGRRKAISHQRQFLVGAESKSGCVSVHGRYEKLSD